MDPCPANLEVREGSNQTLLLDSFKDLEDLLRELEELRIILWQGSWEILVSQDLLKMLKTTNNNSSNSRIKLMREPKQDLSKLSL